MELPKVGGMFKKDQEIVVIESIKSAVDVYCPVSGKVIEVNEELKSKPELISKSPLKDGWLFKLEISDKKELDELMNQQEFKKFIGLEG